MEGRNQRPFRQSAICMRSSVYQILMLFMRRKVLIWFVRIYSRFRKGCRISCSLNFWISSIRESVEPVFDDDDDAICFSCSEWLHKISLWGVIFFNCCSIVNLLRLFVLFFLIISVKRISIHNFYYFNCN